MRLPFRHTGDPIESGLLCNNTLEKLASCYFPCYCYRMKSEVTSSTRSTAVEFKDRHHGDTYTKVLDGNKQPIRGLWIRNGRYYAQLRVVDPHTGEKKTRRIALTNKDGAAVQTAAEARAELGRLMVQRTDNTLPVLRKTPCFAEYVTHYLEVISSGHGTKKPGTISKERSTLALWTAHFKRLGLAEIRLDQIRRSHINGFMEARQKAGMTPRTINLDLIAFRNVLKRGLDDGHLQRLPTEGLRPLKTTTPKRQLFTSADLDTFCKAAFGTKTNASGESAPLTRNAQELVDYVRLMAYCGARRNEAIALRWEDVDFTGRQLTIGASGDTKNRKARVVDFNPKLEAHLKAMHTRRDHEVQWLFPSPQRGMQDLGIKTFRESLDLVRKAAKLPTFQFHDCRHHFISMCVMSGIDFMTIAAWAGHQDGGVLIGRVYGHLANEHRQLMASRLAFEPVVLPSLDSPQTRAVS